MERYVEKKRERRRRDFRRVVERSVARMRLDFKGPERLAYRNPHATWDDVFQARRQALAALEQLIDSGHRDEEPGRRRLKWRGPWP